MHLTGLNWCSWVLRRCSGVLRQLLQAPVTWMLLDSPKPLDFHGLSSHAVVDGFYVLALVLDRLGSFPGRFLRCRQLLLQAGSPKERGKHLIMTFVETNSHIACIPVTNCSTQRMWLCGTWLCARRLER